MTNTTAAIPRNDSEGFLAAATEKNFDRLSWLIAALIGVNAVILLVDYDLSGLLPYLPRVGQSHDLIIGPVLLAGLLVLKRLELPVAIKARMIAVAVALEAVASAWYFYVALHRFGPTAVFALTIIALGVFVLMPVRQFAIIVVVSLALHLGLTLASSVPLAMKVIAVAHGIAAGVISIVAQYFLYTAGMNNFRKDMLLAKETRRLSAANAQLEERCKALEETKVVAAHDLRGPLESLVAALELASERREWRHEPHASLIRESINTCVGVLDLAGRWLTEDSLQASRQEVEGDLARVVQSVAHLMSPKAATKGIHVRVELAEPFLPCRRANPTLESALENLVDNAIEYSPPGSEILVQLVRREHGYTIAVLDEGPGIPEKERERLFQRFFRASNRPQTERESNGLGLYIAHRRVASLGGTLDYEARLPHGSIFRITIPYPIQAAPLIGAKPANVPVMPSSPSSL